MKQYTTALPQDPDQLKVCKTSVARHATRFSTATIHQTTELKVYNCSTRTVRSVLCNTRGVTQGRKPESKTVLSYCTSRSESSFLDQSEAGRNRGCDPEENTGAGMEKWGPKYGKCLQDLGNHHKKGAHSL